MTAPKGYAKLLVGSLGRTYVLFEGNKKVAVSNLSKGELREQGYVIRSSYTRLNKRQLNQLSNRRSRMFKLLAARLVVFTAAVLWVIGWLGVGLLGWGALAEWLGDIDPTWVVIPLEVWYVATIIVVGAWVAMKGFRFVGKWTRE